MNYLISLLLMAAVLSGWNSKAEATSYPSTVIWNDTIYSLASDEIDSHDLGEEIGKVKRLKRPVPRHNGESNMAPAGSLLYEVNGADIDEVIAVQVGDTYVKAIKHAPISSATDAGSQGRKRAWIAIGSAGGLLMVLALIIGRRSRKQPHEK